MFMKGKLIYRNFVVKTLQGVPLLVYSLVRQVFILELYISIRSVKIIWCISAHRPRINQKLFTDSIIR